jgi:hypothetical protein
MKKLMLFLLFSGIFLSSCGASKSTKSIPQPLPSPSDKWSVKMTQSGGIAGVLLVVEANSHGQLIVQDQRSQKSISTTLTSQAAAELKNLILNIPATITALPPSACADCFIYDLEIQSQGRNINIHADDVTIKNSGVGDLITELMSIRNGALKANP